MARFVFFFLLLVNAGLAAWVYLHRDGPKSPPPPEVNAASLKIISVTDPAKAQADALAARKLAQSLSGAACVDFAVKPPDGNRAQVQFAAMLLGDRISSRNAEEFSRYALTLPAQKDRKSAETLMANLKKAGVKDVSILSDNAVSLGLYSTEDAAKKAEAELQDKARTLVKDVAITPRNSQLKEVVFTIREPDLNMVARLTILQREYEGSSLKAITCPAAPLPSSVSVQDAKSADKAKP